MCKNVQTELFGDIEKFSWQKKLGVEVINPCQKGKDEYDKDDRYAE